ncbi:hypothetical protein DL96DRAFT_1458764 [Flagelloscypha sp. PMI_526]|nr:hypothetical protein DL96DRAFT_1458764 [Flagelloscypha sp. PMI_526]
MAASTLQFTTLDVFTSARYKGNPLAIVQVPETVSLSQEQKQSIAAEFNLSETVFLHTPGTSANNSDEPIQIDIFTTSAELPFAGHPTVGTSHFLLEKLDKDQIILKTKAGLIPAVRGASGGARLSAPLDFAIHPNLAFPNIRAMFPDVDFVQESQDPVVSPVKGLCFLLVEVASEAALAKLRTFSEKELVLPDGHAGEWQGFFALYAFYVSGEGKLRTRMFFDGIEDPATGAAAITLGGYLGATRGMTDLEIIQGVEMGRKSEILVKVSLGEKGNNGTFQVKKVELEGSAVQVMSGELVPPM